MKNIIILGVFGVIFLIIFIMNKWASPRKSDLPPYSGNRHEIEEESYNRFILVKNTTKEYLLEGITDYGKLSGNGEYIPYNFWIGLYADWHIVGVDEALSFNTYHNLICWFTDYKENAPKPDYSLGLV